MKTRTGLVSNSSSSSFIVVFPKKPETVDETFKYMFNSVDGRITHRWADDFSLTHKEISEQVFNDLKDKKIPTLKELQEEFHNQIYHEAYDAFESSMYYRCRDEVERDINAVLKCNEMFGSTEYIELLKKIKETENEYNIKRDELVRKHKYVYGQPTTNEYEYESQELHEKRIKKLGPLWNKKEKIIQKAANKRAKEYIAEKKGWWYVILSYADDSGQLGSFLEHSNIFRNLPHESISHH